VRLKLFKLRVSNLPKLTLTIFVCNKNIHKTTQEKGLTESNYVGTIKIKTYVLVNLELLSELKRSPSNRSYAQFFSSRMELNKISQLLFKATDFIRSYSEFSDSCQNSILLKSICEEI
jgi:hypothetical protein